MQITGVTLTNWLAHRHLDCELRPMTVVAGPNGCGKSSLADGIAFAILGALRRVQAKGDRPMLLSEGGAGKGAVSLHCGEATITRDIATGKLSTKQALPLPEDAVKEAIAFVLEPAAFARLTPDERRSLLLKVARIDITPGGIKKVLAERGHGPELLKTLPDDEAVEQWAKRAERSASEHRGAWRAVTGETYGSQKAEDWKPANTENVDPAAIEAAKEELALARQTAADRQRELGAIEQALATHEAQKGKLAGLREKAANIALARASLKDKSSALTAAKAALKQADAALADVMARLEAHHLKCPHCAGALRIVDRRVEAYQPRQDAANEADRLNAFTAQTRAAEQVRFAEEALKRADGAVQEAEAARVALSEVAEGEPPTDDRRQEVQGEIDALQARIAELEAGLEELRQADQAARRAMQATVEAANAYRAVKAWVAIGEALAPSGIPGELLAKGLGSFNETLQWIASETGWRQVAIRDDMAIVASGRPYGLLCESEQWRADASLATAIALHSETRFLVLDRLDVLEPQHRRTALAWLYGLTKTEELDSTLVLGTMVSPPQVPVDVGVIWLGAAEEAKAA